MLLNQKAIALKKQGIDIISFGVGEPDFDTPENIKFAAIKAIVDGYTKYTDVDGSVELKTAIKNKLLRENRLEYNLDEIIVSCGGKHVIHNLFMATLNDGDEVIIPKPYWVSYPEMVRLNTGVPILLDCDQNFKIRPKDLDAAISKRTKWVILNSPSNPSGACYTKDELIDLAEIIKFYPNLHIMSDDIYEHIIFDKFKFYNIALVAPELKSRIFIVNGVSKSYSMTGWRIGYGAGDRQIIKAMSTIQSQTTSNPCSISQAAAIEALNGDQSFIATNALEFERKRNKALEILTQTNYLKCNKPNGAFYLFVDCKAAFGKTTPQGNTINSCDDFTMFLLEHAHVAVVPGAAFGLEGFVRMSFATSHKNIEVGCANIVSACNNLLS